MDEVGQPTTQNLTQGQVLVPNNIPQNSPNNTVVKQVQPEVGPNPNINTPIPPKNNKKVFYKVGLILLIMFVILGGLIVLALKFGQGVRLFGNKGEITWWGMTLDESVANNLIQEYKKKNPSVKITYIKQSPTDYRERLTNSLASGKGPDLFEIHNTWPVMFKSYLDTMPGSFMSQTEFAKNYYPVIVSDMTLGNSVVGVPLYYDGLTLYVNQDIFALSGMQPPKTWGELTDLATQLTQKEKTGRILQSGVALGITDNINHWPEILALMMYQNGANLAKPNSPQAIDAINFYQQFYSNLRVWDSTLPTSTTAFATGKLAMYFGITSEAKDILKMNPNLKFKTVPLPQLPKNSPSEPDIAYANYWTESVWKQSTNKDIAWDFLKFLSTQESLQKTNQGLQSSNVSQRLYPVASMNSVYRDDPILGSLINQAQFAKSWFLVDETNDGTNGINTQMDQAFDKAIGQNQDMKTVMQNLDANVNKVLTQFGVIVK